MQSTDGNPTNSLNLARQLPRATVLSASEYSHLKAVLSGTLLRMLDISSLQGDPSDFVVYISLKDSSGQLYSTWTLTAASPGTPKRRKSGSKSATSST
jgi:hypothetical protein